MSNQQNQKPVSVTFEVPRSLFTQAVERSALGNRTSIHHTRESSGRETIEERIIVDRATSNSHVKLTYEREILHDAERSSDGESSATDA